MSISVVIPVYNRPDELYRLLSSLLDQITHIDEVVVVDDGSTEKHDTVISRFGTKFNLKYLTQKNQGPAIARNTGAAAATSEWLLFFDSDCEIPPGYFNVIRKAIKSTPDMVLFGGPDAAHHEYTPLQKAINYSMTSFLTTGGIRGGSEKADTYYPRTFNMGVKKFVFNEVNGFQDLRFGEDLDFSMRVIKQGYVAHFLPKAKVYHRRRRSITAFFKQVFNSGMARVVLQELHPGSLKIVHLLPALFVVFLIISLLWSVFNQEAIIPVAAIGLLWLIHAIYQTGSFLVGGLSMVCAFIQLTGYGSGFTYALFKKMFGGGYLPDQFAFRKSYYD